MAMCTNTIKYVIYIVMWCIILYTYVATYVSYVAIGIST